MRLTIRGKCDGFGAQFMAMLSGIAYCHQHGFTYVHTPIEHILPVGTFESDFDHLVQPANEFIDRIIGNLGLSAGGAFTHEALHMHGEINQAPDRYYSPAFVGWLAGAYDRPRPDLFEPRVCNVAIHVRRGDIDASEEQRWVELSEVSIQIDRLRARNPGAHFHVFSWRDPCEALEATDVTVHCGEGGEDFLEVFNCFVHADILIIGASCLSMAAGLFTTGPVIAPTIDMARTDWASHALPDRWYW